MPPKRVDLVSLMKARDRKQSRAKKKNMKRVTKKGAYKKKVKQQIVMRRAPVVETKQRVHSDIAQINGYPAGAGADNIVNPLNWRQLVTDDAFTLLPLLSYYRNTHGFNDYNVIGNNIFSKYLNFKCQLRFPQNEFQSYTDSEGESYTARNIMIQDPTKVYLICGWVTQHMNYPITNSPSPSLPPQSDADQDAIENYITQQLRPYFDDDEDKLQFRPKQTTNIKIEKYVQFKPRLETAIGTRAVPVHTWTSSTIFDGSTKPSVTYPTSDQYGQNYGPNPDTGSAGSVVSATSATTSGHGSIPEVSKSHSFRCMKKIALTEGKETTFPVDSQNLYMNNSWLPFCVIYNPNYEQQVANTKVDTETGRLTQTQFMSYRWNDAHYFTDS